MAGAIMRFLPDTANLGELPGAASFGNLDGADISSSLAAKKSKPFRKAILEICKIGKNGAVNAEVVSADCEGMLPKPVYLAGLEMLACAREKARAMLRQTSNQ